MQILFLLSNNSSDFYSEDIINVIKRFAIILGYLSRTGLCVNPAENFKIKDPRLNFWGVAYVLPDDANPKCTESECSEDSHCDADRKCCKNYCGGMVCTPTSKQNLLNFQYCTGNSPLYMKRIMSKILEAKYTEATSTYGS